MVHNGRNAGTPVIRRLCGQKSNVVITSNGNQMFIIFTSDARNERKGFQATFVEGKHNYIDISFAEILVGSEKIFKLLSHTVKLSIFHIFKI